MFFQENFVMKTLKVGELKSKFSHVLKKVQAGEEFIISFGKNGKKLLSLFPMKNINPVHRVVWVF